MASRCLRTPTFKLVAVAFFLCCLVVFLTRAPVVAQKKDGATKENKYQYATDSDYGDEIADKKAGYSSEPPPEVFMLATQFRGPGYLENVGIAGLLHREIMRQGFLIAARDELGLPTRDQTLREPFVDAKGNKFKPFCADGRARLDGKAVVKFFKGEGEYKQELWSKEYPFGANSYDAYRTLAPEIEKASRNEMVELLKKQGFKSKAKPPAESIEIPRAVEDNLAAMNFIPQLAAVRWAHQDIRERGESPASLGVLVRGYSHLGMLTEYYYNTMYLAFKARALLYAERMIAKYPDDVESLWYRAYARSMVGMHKAALVQLDEIAQKTSTWDPDYDTLPTCMRIVKPRCQFDIEQFEKLGKEHKSLRYLTEFLRFRTYETMRDNLLLLQKSEAILERIPDTCCIYCVLHQNQPMGIKGWAAKNAPEAAARHLPRRLAALDGLPPELTKMLVPHAGDLLTTLFGEDEKGQKAEPLHVLARELVKAGAMGSDVGEPSWAAMGNMIHEVTFVTCANRILQARIKGETDHTDLVEEMLPMVEDHSYAPYIKCWKINPMEDGHSFARILGDLRFEDSRFHMRSLYRSIWHFGVSGNPSIGRRGYAGASRNFTAYGMLQLMRTSGTYSPSYGMRDMYVREFGKISPYSPERLRTMIEWTPSPSKEQLAGWEREVGDSKQGLMHLGFRYEELGEYEKAVEFLTKVIDDSPYRKAYVALADAYIGMGKDDMWLPAMEKYLETEEVGLEHASMRSEIAHRLMREFRWQEAEPFAKRAAETHALWAMQCAAMCYEGLGDMKQSEEWIKQASNGYSWMGGADWYCWCRRNGKGDLETARDCAKGYVEFNTGRSVRWRQSSLGVYFLMEGDNQRAVEYLRKRFLTTTGLYSATHLVLLCGETKDTRSRDLVLRELAKKYETKNAEKNSPETRYARIIEECMTTTPPKKPDAEAVESILDEADLDLQTTVLCGVGRVHDILGDRATAEKHYNKALALGRFNLHCCTLAGYFLNKDKAGGNRQTDELPRLKKVF